MTEQEAYNSVDNHIKTIAVKASKSLTSYSTNGSDKALELFREKSEVIYVQALYKASKQGKKYSNKRVTREMIVDDAILDISGLSQNISKSFATNLMNFLKNLAKAIWNSIKLMIDKVVSLFSNPGALLDGLINFATGLFNSLYTSLRAIVAGVISKFMKALKAMIASVVGRIVSIINMGIDAINKAIEAYDAIIKGIKDIKDFYKRAKKLATTAQEIQPNIPDIKGKLKKNALAMKGTVEDKILTPQLKSDINAVKEFTADPLAKMLGFLSSLIPKVNIKSIREPKPTGAKSEYTKIVANVNKAGFTDISDSTPGNVRKVAIHPTGTYTAMLNDGSMNTKTTGDKLEITDKDWNITTNKDKVEIVVGDSKIEIRKNYFENIQGDQNTNIDGNISTVVGKNVSNDFKADYSGKINGNYDESVAGNRTEKTSGNFTETVGGNHKETITGSLTIQVTGNVNIVSSGNATVTATKNVIINGSKIMLG